MGRAVKLADSVRSAHPVTKKKRSLFFLRFFHMRNGGTEAAVVPGNTVYLIIEDKQGTGSPHPMNITLLKKYSLCETSM